MNSDWRNSISKVFHYLTKIERDKSFKALPEELWPKEWKKIESKQYLRFPKQVFGKNDLPDMKLQEVFLNRRSQRNFSGKCPTFNDLVKLLYWSAGLIEISKGDFNKSYRTYPSAGARYPLEIYFAILSKNDRLEEGLYHYDIFGNCLEFLFPGNFRKDIVAAVGQDMTKKVPVVLFISGVFGRTQMKYGERGYRFVLLEAGHLGQNISLVCASLGFKCCAVGGFDDDAVNRLFDLAGERESILYLFEIGF